jgi:chromosome segregation protein
MNIFQEEFPDIIGSEGVYGWADRFIKCPEEYWLLYRYLLDEYVIVENKTVAEKLSKDNFIKFITLDGDIITNSFVRTGGRTNIENIKLGREKLINDYSAGMKELEMQIKDAAILLENAKSMHDSIVIEGIENGIEELKALISDIENETKQVVYKRDQSNIHIEENNKKISVLSESNREITAKIDGLIKELEEKENTKYLKEKELDAFTTNLENLTNDFTEKRDEYNSFNIEVTKVQGELNTLMNDRTRTQNSIETRKNTISARVEEVNECESEVNTLQETTGGVLEDGSITGQTAVLNNLNAEKAVIEADLNFVMTDYNTRRSVIDELENQQKKLREMRDNLIDNIHKGEMKLADARSDIREHKEKIKEYYGITIEYNFYEDNETYDFSKIKFEIDKLRMRLKQLGGTGQMELAIYEEEKNTLLKLLEERDDLVKAEEDLINLIEQINQTAQKKFIETFDKIRNNFRSIFTELFMEGDEADLKLVIDEENTDPLEAKIDIIAKPRGKRPQLIDLLSGGEKTLTAIALLFAIYQVKPSPFCILDEVDAPLDDANVDRFVKIIRKFSKDTQFIIVTHNKRTMEAADSMYGVTMAEEGISTIVNVKFSDKLVSKN